jgi:O-glycosyl hydrolase
MRASLPLLIALLSLATPGCSRCSAPLAFLPEQTVQVAVDPQTRYQTIDGFGTAAPGQLGAEDWFQRLYYQDLGASILRLDLTPPFKPPYADFACNSPWFHGQPGLPGPDGNNVRVYRDAADYVRAWAGRSAEIAVMGPDIEANQKYFDFEAARARGALAKRGFEERAQLGDFKLIGSVWSPAPWLKLSSGARIEGLDGIMPKEGTPFPFIWGGNFAGGRLDTSNEPMALFDDRAQGGSGPTSALTQFARGLAAYVLGFQRNFGVRFYAISIQNELNFETFYNSCTYPRAEQYIAALKTVRRAFDAHPELAPIQLMGPEDLLGGDGYSLWQFGAGDDQVQKNLQYLAAMAGDPEAQSALSFFSIHGYAPDGVTGAGHEPWGWRAWADGWNESPAKGLPDRVQGFRAFGKKSWMTETSGEAMRWAPETPEQLADSALGLALKIHQALTHGFQSAWLYWQLAEEMEEAQRLTDVQRQASSPKYVAAKHYFRWIRPGAQRVSVTLSKEAPIHVSAFAHAAQNTLTLILINTSDVPQTLRVEGAWGPDNLPSEALLSDAKTAYASIATAAFQAGSLTLPAHALATVVTALPLPQAGTRVTK